MLFEFKRIYLPPGQKVLLQDVTWQELETIIEELGEHRAARIAYATIKAFRNWVRQSSK
ncbi:MULTISPECIES: hypothetical protein [Calothrix]|uniref:hypothetical protein n=1 Tax=Calothrix TaxID=1186 RepID=UPI001F552562|nr:MULTISPECIES: hypothetical protein [Calothrix]